ncbi:RNA polymerase subunit sigma-70 [Kribbella shirazensis]|uniref:RNA polymerase sigma factor n=1 Tax=Kribbella shirazensis TaxID=1105143 RepID=A0A7X5ZY61_9ACTN|nr:RNA polymerase subunit sigma-70 [Kribbella shirazensis]NIK54662.1 RNA polymerase sigma-70 factor (ECF subfamily) [Kribbella shirazensis]
MKDESLEEHRPRLRAHCYRLTGNVADADDLVQETFLRAWRSRDRFEGRSAVQTWLYRIATNIYLDQRKSAVRRSVPSGDPLEWSTELGPYPQQPGVDPASGALARETVELALIAALMHLPPRQRAVFVLSEVSGWTPTEIGESLGLARTAVNSLLQRGRQTLRNRAPEDRYRWTRPELTAADEDVLRRYAAAIEPADFRALLADDVRITMPPDPPVIGIDAAAEFLGRPLDWRTVPVAANGRPALACYLRHPGSTLYEATVVDVLRIENGLIVESNAFVGARHVLAFGLPTTLR